MLGLMSIASMVIIFLIIEKFRPHHEELRYARLKLRLLEIVVQLMLISRILVTAFQYAFVKTPSTTYVISYMSVFLFISEILPLSIVIF